MPRRKLIALLLPLLAPVLAFAQDFDTSGNGSLKGDYFIREVLIGGQNSSTGAITSANSVIGVATFDGKGGYTFKGQGTGTGGLGTVTQQAFTGSYSAAANGMLVVQSFINEGDFCSGGLSAIGPSAFVASATDNFPNPIVSDILVAIPAGGTATAASLKGGYTAAYIDYLNADINMIRQSSFNLTADGAGGLGSIAVTGNAINLSGGISINQTVPGVTYTLGGTGAGTVNFGAANSGQLISGSKTFYLSADGNIVLGGNPGGLDLFVGIRALTAPATNATISGEYYLAALEDGVVQQPTVTTHSIDAYYGSTNATGTGIAISHNRIVDFFSNSVFDFTYNSQFGVSSTGTFTDGEFYNYALGANGSAFVASGAPGYYSLLVGLGVPKFSGTGVYLNPIGVVSAASFAPITNPIAPNEIVTLFGSGLAAGAVSATQAPLPTILGNVQVTVNGQLAPLFSVTPGQISFVVPQSVSPFFKVYNATIQVINNGVKSNPVTVYTALSSPGVFSAGGNGIGPGLAVHLSGTLVTPANPAKTGEVVVVFATGMGSTTPSVPDGFPAPTTTLSHVDDPYVQLSFGAKPATVSFTGLVPTFAGFYQLNATVAPGTSAGNAYINLASGSGATSEVTLAVSGSSNAAIESPGLRPAARLRPHAKAATFPRLEGRKGRTR